MPESGVPESGVPESGVPESGESPASGFGSSESPEHAGIAPNARMARGSNRVALKRIGSFQAGVDAGGRAENYHRE
ncbi:hypothetical protein MFU01_10970 [Myxococcus fulvus]|uniref:Uncharacterized protein n=1 Tax=Myxococcus fulvus TaxID=33 RepID=A0A511SVY1_MYXFU|nr:hypothetical protein MFU01_10970 [Myxococcus fulvus]